MVSLQELACTQLCNGVEKPTTMTDTEGYPSENE